MITGCAFRGVGERAPAGEPHTIFQEEFAEI